MTTDPTPSESEDILPAGDSTGGPFRGHGPAPIIKLEDPAGGDPQCLTLTNASNRYIGKGKLGAGGMAIIRAAEDPNLGRQVAVKALHPHLSGEALTRSRFVREARIMAQLEHPNIVPVHELGTNDDGTLYFTMKRVEGVTLRHILGQLQRKRKKYLRDYPRARVLEIFIDICNAVAFAHNRGVVHRDLKPDNILVGSYGEVLVMDWGLARSVAETAEDEGGGEKGVRPWLDEMDPMHTMVGSISGSPYFMSPEQARGAAVDQRSDIYSLGAMLYEALTHQYLANGTKVEEVLHSVVHDPIVPPRKRSPKQCIARELEAICMKALAKDRADRYADLETMREDLVKYCGGQSVSVYRDSLPRRAWKACLRHPVISASVFAAVVATVASFSTFLVARQHRLEGFIESAEIHRLEGNRIYDEKLALARELLSMQSSSGGGSPSPEEQALAEKIESLHSRSENQYQLAIGFFSTVGKMMVQPGPVVIAGRQDILRRKIEYACLVGDFPEAEKWVDLLRLAIRDRFGEIPEVFQETIRTHEQFIAEARDAAGEE